MEDGKMSMFGRTYYCGEISEKNEGETVVLKGWVQKGETSADLFLLI